MEEEGRLWGAPLLASNGGGVVSDWQPMGRVLLFAYGTLRDSGVQQRVFGRTLATAPARLSGWRVEATMVRARYPGIVRDPEAVALGELQELRPGELAKCDLYEDVPRLYRRRRVDVRCGRQAVRCWVYVPANANRGRIAGRGLSRLAWRE